MSKYQTSNTTAVALPKLCGADIELGNFIAGEDSALGTGYEASQALLDEIEGLPVRQPHYLNYGWASSQSVSRAGNPQDVRRRFLTGNGGCAYIDLDHLELCLPEVLDAFDHVAAWHAMLNNTRAALDSANEGRSGDRRIKVLVNNSDGQGNSYGSHLNFLISRRTFDDLFQRKAHYLQFLASFQVSSILLTGQGKVGSENGQPSTPYQISQRADFFEVLQGTQTTFNRPIVNARDEALCGRHIVDDASAPARLHVIFFDSSLAHGSALFRVGPMQLMLTLLELGLINTRLILNDPLSALQSYSHDPTLKARAKLISGEHITALELQGAYLDEVKRYAAQGVFKGIVPRAEEIIALWEDTLVKLANRDWMAVAQRGIDWVLKLLAIERAMEQRRGLHWGTPEVKVMDLLYSSLDKDGLYWAYESSGFTEPLVTAEDISYFAENPPLDTRAWTRAMLLRRATAESVVSVDWDMITFKLRGRHSWPTYRIFDMHDPLRYTRSDAQSVFDHCEDIADLLDGLESLSSPESLPFQELITQ